MLSKLAVEVDGARSAVNVRQELVDAGFSVGHLSDEQLRELGSRIADATSPGRTRLSRTPALEPGPRRGHNLAREPAVPDDRLVDGRAVTVYEETVATLRALAERARTTEDVLFCERRP